MPAEQKTFRPFDPTSEMWRYGLPAAGLGAAGLGLAGAGLGALGASKGNRLRRALKWALGGAALGALGYGGYMGYKGHNQATENLNAAVSAIMAQQRQTLGTRLDDPKYLQAARDKVYGSPEYGELNKTTRDDLRKNWDENWAWNLTDERKLNDKQTLQRIANPVERTHRDFAREQAMGLEVPLLPQGDKSFAAAQNAQLWDAVKGDRGLAQRIAGPAYKVDDGTDEKGEPKTRDVNTILGDPHFSPNLVSRLLGTVRGQ